MQDLTRELTSRGIYEGETRKEKEKLLVEEMSGVQRVPALLYTAPTVVTESRGNSFAVNNKSKICQNIFFTNPLNVLEQSRTTTL